MSNPFVQLVLDAHAEGICMERYCTTCGNLEFRRRLANLAKQYGTPLADMLVELTPREIVALPAWDYCLEFAFMQLGWPGQRERVLNQWADRLDGGVGFADIVLFRIVRGMPRGSAVWNLWVKQCIDLACSNLGNPYESLVESLFWVIGNDVSSHPRLIQVARKLLASHDIRKAWRENMGVGPLGFFDKRALRKFGFQGFKSVYELTKGRGCVQVPPQKGVYVIYRTSTASPRFLAESVCQHTESWVPTELLDRLKTNWVPGAQVLNIGKATSLRKRIRQYMNCTMKPNHGHRGGRYIWQLEDWENLEVAWKVLTDNEEPREVERWLLCEFRDLFGGWPFANMTG